MGRAVWLIEHFRELWRHRVLISSLVRREVTLRYRGSVLGYLWTLLNPLLLLSVYYLVFSQFMRVVTVEHYAVFLFVGILPWLWLASSLNNGVLSIAIGGGLITRVCMPPQVLPCVAVLSNLANFVFALPVVIAAAWLAGLAPTPALLLLPLVLLVLLAFLYGLSLLAATLAVPFRDMQFLVQNAVTIWFFLTPIAYPFETLPEGWKPLLAVNPATALIHPFQRILYERGLPDPATLGLGTLWALGAIIAGVFVFERLRQRLVEEI